MRKHIQRIRYGLPKQIKNVWWNQAVHMSDVKYPEVLPKGGTYIDCEIGIVIPMKELTDNKQAYYEVVKIKRKRGSDWFYPSDAYECDLIFHSIK